MVDRQSREVDYEDDYITENTRAAYPLEYIQNYVPEARPGTRARSSSSPPTPSVFCRP